MSNLKKILVKLKKEVATDKGRNELSDKLIWGICDYTDTHVISINEIIKLKSLFSTWKHYSGSKSFPIEGSSRSYTANKNNAFDPKVHYCKLRLGLLDHCISELDKQNTTN